MLLAGCVCGVLRCCCCVSWQLFFYSVNNETSTEYKHACNALKSSKQMGMKYFLETMQSKVSSEMEGANEKAVESMEYKEVMKKIIVSDG